MNLNRKPNSTAASIQWLYRSPRGTNCQSAMNLSTATLTSSKWKWVRSLLSLDSLSPLDLISGTLLLNILINVVSVITTVRSNTTALKTGKLRFCVGIWKRVKLPAGGDVWFSVSGRVSVWMWSRLTDPDLTRDNASFRWRRQIVNVKALNPSAQLSPADVLCALENLLKLSPCLYC